MMTYSHDEVVHLKASMLSKMGAITSPIRRGKLRALYA